MYIFGASHLFRSPSLVALHTHLLLTNIFMQNTKWLRGAKGMYALTNTPLPFASFCFMYSFQCFGFCFPRYYSVFFSFFFCCFLCASLECFVSFPRSLALVGLTFILLAFHQPTTKSTYFKCVCFMQCKDDANKQNMQNNWKFNARSSHSFLASHSRIALESRIKLKRHNVPGERDNKVAAVAVIFKWFLPIVRKMKVFGKWPHLLDRKHTNDRNRTNETAVRTHKSIRKRSQVETWSETLRE